MSVRELLERIDSRELAEWMAFVRLENKRMKGEPEEDDVGNKIFATLKGFKGKQK